MRLKRILTMTAPLLLYGAAKAVAATSGLPADGPVTTFVNFISTDVAYGLVGTGFAAVAGHCVMGRDFGLTLHHGVGAMVGRAWQGLGISPLVLGWLVAVGIRLATGSATVATITAAGIVAPLAAGMDRSAVALLVLAIGSGSLFFSHINDAGFWLVKEYFGLSIADTLKSWSVMETIISIVGLAGVFLLRAFV